MAHPGAGGRPRIEAFHVGLWRRGCRGERGCGEGCVRSWGRPPGDRTGHSGLHQRELGVRGLQGKQRLQAAYLRRQRPVWACSVLTGCGGALVLGGEQGPWHHLEGEGDQRLAGRRRAGSCRETVTHGWDTPPVRGDFRGSIAALQAAVGERC